jgi:hypothetical protein
MPTLYTHGMFILKGIRECFRDQCPTIQRNKNSLPTGGLPKFTR